MRILLFKLTLLSLLILDNVLVECELLEYFLLMRSFLVKDSFS
jgi:hypothetical protein